MRINNFNPNASHKFNSKANVLNKGDFSSTLIEAQKDSYRNELDSSFSKISEMSNILISTQSYRDIVKYKRMIKEFLSDVLKHGYELSKNDSFWESKYYSTVNIVNEKVESLTKDILLKQKSNIDVASSIDQIEGLLIDVYR